MAAEKKPNAWNYAQPISGATSTGMYMPNGSAAQRTNVAAPPPANNGIAPLLPLGSSWVDQLGQAEGYFNQGYQTEQNGWNSVDNEIAWQQGLNDQIQVGNTQAMGDIYRQLGWQDEQNVIFNNQTQGLIGELGGYTTQANNNDWANYGQYAGDLNTAIGQNNAALSGLQGTYGSMGQLNSGVSWGGDLTSQAATARADASSIAAQNRALSQLQGAADGSLNQVSQASGARADAGAIYGQMESARALSVLGGVGADIQARDLEGYSDLKGIAKGSLDVSLDDNEGYQSLLNARDRYEELSTPEVTAAERFIYEQARLRQENDERGMRAANATDARMRGMGGGGGEIVRNALGGQQTSQNRLLSDLGAQANAVQRSMAALGGYADTSESAAGMDLSNDTNNNNRRYDANGQIVGLNNNIAQFNQQRQVNATNAAGGLYTQARGQSFNEDFSRKNAADQTAHANADRRLGAMNSSGQLASTQRSQSFNESFSRGQAADATAQFNRMGSLSVDQFNANYRASERDSQWNRSTDMFTAQQGTAASNAGYATQRFDAGRSTNADTFGRNTNLIAAKDSANARQNSLASGQTDRRIGAAGAQIGVNDGYWNRSQALSGQRIGATQGRTASTTNYLSGLAGVSAGRAQNTGNGQWNLPKEEESSFMNGTGKWDESNENGVWKQLD